MAQRQAKLTKWSKEKPTLVGEYNASMKRDAEIRRWWDGEHWSMAYRDRSSEFEKRQKRRMKASIGVGNIIQWRGLVEKPHYPFQPGPLEKM